MTYTNLSIDNTNKPIVIETEKTNSVTEQTQDAKSSKKSEPLFMLKQTPHERFLSKLFERNIIDRTGRVIIDLKDFQPSTQQLDQQNAEYLEKEIYIEIGDTDNFHKHLVIA